MVRRYHIVYKSIMDDRKIPLKKKKADMDRAKAIKGTRC